MNRKPNGSSLVASKEDLLARCEIVPKEVLSEETTVAGSSFFLPCYLGLPLPPECQRVTLESLVPVYMEVLVDMKHNKKSSRCFQAFGNVTDRQESALLFIYFLSYLFNVEAHDESNSKLIGPSERIVFDEICRNKLLIKWCRQALQRDNPISFHPKLRKRSLHILINFASLRVEKPLIKDYIYGDYQNEWDGFLEFHKDLAAMMSNSDFDERDVIFVIKAQYYFYTNLENRGNRWDLPCLEEMTQAFLKHKGALTKEDIEKYENYLFLQCNNDDDVDLRGTALERTCEAQNCNKPAKDKCGHCKVASYCSAECQQSHWDIHKPICKKWRRKAASMIDHDKMEAARASAQEQFGNISPALVRQNITIETKSKPSMDEYFIFGHRSTLKIGFDDSSFKERREFFLFARSLASDHPWFLLKMYQCLLDRIPDNQPEKQLLHAQVTEEYGIDPLFLDDGCQTLECLAIEQKACAESEAIEFYFFHLQQEFPDWPKGHLPEGTIVCAARRCYKPGKNIGACCKMVRYCSKPCQVADWKARHKQNCPQRGVSNKSK